VGPLGEDESIGSERDGRKGGDIGGRTLEFINSCQARLQHVDAPARAASEDPVIQLGTKPFDQNVDKLALQSPFHSLCAVRTTENQRPFLTFLLFTVQSVSDLTFAPYCKLTTLNLVLRDIQGSLLHS